LRPVFHFCLCPTLIAQATFDTATVAPLHLTRRVKVPLRRIVKTPTHATRSRILTSVLQNTLDGALKMEEEDRGLIFGGVHYTIIPSDELDNEKTKLVRKRFLRTHTYSFANRLVATR